jgi:MFS family permease
VHPETTCTTSTDSGQRRGLVVTTLGFTQILAWGSTYYLPAVLAKPIAADTRWPFTWVIGGLSLGLLVAGLVSPKVGRAIQRRGGRPILAFSSVIFALGLIGVAVAGSLVGYLAAWAVLGLAMAAGLYDAAFATLGGLYGSSARVSITSLTIFAGFAGTVSWPFSAVLVATIGWRGACLVYAGLHLAIALPAHLLFIPGSTAVLRSEKPQVPRAPASSACIQATELAWSQQQVALFVMIATSLTLGAAITAVMTVHLLSILQARGLTLSAAVALGALVGPSQVGARVYEIAIGRRFHPTWTFLVSGCLLTGGLTVLLLASPLVALGLVLYGGGVGIMTIAKGTLPLAVFGTSGYAILLGRLALPSLVAQAIAPPAAAVLLEHQAGAWEVLAILASLAVFNLALIVALRLTSTAQSTAA